jgi:hypothetical protein
MRTVDCTRHSWQRVIVHSHVITESFVRPTIDSTKARKMQTVLVGATYTDLVVVVVGAVDARKPSDERVTHRWRC